MKEHPIIFNGPMVKAILEGRKTMTRRPVKPRPPIISKLALKARDGSCEWKFFSDPFPTVGQAVTKWVKSPYFPGDHLWVRETWRITKNLTTQHCLYAADYSPSQVKGLSPWTPSIHMPRWASRITLEVTDVRVERVQDITEGDAEAEGIDARPQRSKDWFMDTWDSNLCQDLSVDLKSLGMGHLLQEGAGMILIPRYILTLALLLITACLGLSGMTLWLTDKRLEGMEARAVPNVTNYNFYHGAEAVIQQFPDARIDGEIEKKKGDK